MLGNRAPEAMMKRTDGQTGGSCLHFDTRHLLTNTGLTSTGVGRKKTARPAGDDMRIFILLEDGAEINAF